jgi:Flp pilus assembly protein TadG
MMKISKFHRNRLMREEGSQLIELAFVLPILLLIFAGAVDFGRAWFLYMEVASAAESGALYGLQNPTDISGMQSAALLDAPDLPTLSSSATYGSECQDGTSSVALNGNPPTCSVSVVRYVEVDTTATYQPIIPYPGFQSTFTLTGKSRMRASFQ